MYRQIRQRPPRLVLALLALGGCLLLGWVASRVVARDRSLTEARRAGLIRIGYAVEPPYAFLEQDGTVTGESPEVARLIAQRLSIGQVRWIQTEFGSLISGLEANRFDVIAAGLFITPERARQIAFSAPSFHVTPGLLVRRGNPLGLHAYGDALTTPGAKLIALSGSVEEKLLRELRLAPAQLLAAPDALSARVAVESGLADGLALSLPTLRWMARQDEQGRTEVAAPFHVPPSPLTSRLGYGGFAFRRQDRALRQAWDQALAQFIGSPEHVKLIGRFGFTTAELPGTMTTAELTHE